MPLLKFDSNEEYEYFQFMWFGLRFAPPTVAVTNLRARMMAVSKLGPDEIGRVLKAPCKLDLSDDELDLIVEHLASTDWINGEARDMARQTLRWVVESRA